MPSHEAAVDRRHADLVRFYSLLRMVETKIGGTRTLAACGGATGWPQRGVYFFQEPGENRRDTGAGPRIVRVGTHGLKAHSGATLWSRLAQHKGHSGGGNHRGSIFRLLVGTSLVSRDGHTIGTWGCGSSAPKEIRQGEVGLECAVSGVIGRMPFVWVAVDDESGPQSRRGYIERNAIALLSNYQRALLDAPSETWLGRHCDRERVRHSGLWNSNHVDEHYAPAFLDEFERLILS